MCGEAVAILKMARRYRSADIQDAVANGEGEVEHHTIGISGFDSPTAIGTLNILHHGLLTADLAAGPHIVVAHHNYGVNGVNLVFIWVMLMWEPAPHRGIMRPHKWHTTLVRGVAAMGDGLIAPALQWLQASLNNILHVFVPPDVPYHLHVIRPPWYRSWIFGLTFQDLALCQILRDATKWLLATPRFGPYRLELQPDREDHISWH